VYKVNISIDDVSPHPQSSTKVLHNCYDILSVFPDAKFTLFVPVSYWRTIGPTATPQPLQLDLYPEFCQELQELDKNTFEVCYHGFHHGIPGKSNNDELQTMGYQEALKCIELMRGMVNKSGLSSVFKDVLRPPAWRMSPNVFDACKDTGINTLALSADEYANVTYGDRDKTDHWKDKVIYYTCAPPFKPLELSEKTEIVFHACEWDANLLSDILTIELIQFLKDHEGQYKFSFIEGLL